MKTSGHFDNVVFLYSYCSSSFFFLTFPMTIHSVLNTSVKVSGDAHHYLPRKTSLKLGCLLMHVCIYSGELRSRFLVVMLVRLS